MEGLPVRDQPMGGGNLQARALQEEGEEGKEPEEKFKTLNIWTFLEKTQQHQKKNNRNIKQGSLLEEREQGEPAKKNIKTFMTKRGNVKTRTR